MVESPGVVRETQITARGIVAGSDGQTRVPFDGRVRVPIVHHNGIGRTRRS
jgi:hypothetical protein